MKSVLGCLQTFTIASFPNKLYIFLIQVLAHLAPRLSVCHVIVALQLPWFGGAVLRNGLVEIRVENYYCAVTITVRLHVTQVLN